ncbi:MAG: molybdopterin-dependent oxidoreductase [Bryobacter sp.]|nr:molybdopterin-dependent oxidoreductase [Bryobacter sp.]
MTKEKRSSVCALDCPDACGLTVTVDAASGRALRLQGRQDHPITQGFLCAKVAKYLDREYSPDRLLHPLKRTGRKGSGEFTRASWDEAIGDIAERLAAIVERYGGEAVLPYSYAGTMGLLNGAGMDRRFFHRLGASRLDRTICSSAGSAALMQAMNARLGTEPEQFAEAKLIVAWGANILTTNVHLWPFVVEARRRGARLIVIDPIRTKTAALADQHIPVHPGSDLALALAVGHVILREGWEDRAYAHNIQDFEDYRSIVAGMPPERAAELTGVPADVIEALARDLAQTHPAVIRVNYGIQRSERGGRAVMAVATLAALTGQFQYRGGGLQLSTSGGFAGLNRAALERQDLEPHPTRLCNMTELGKLLTEPQTPPVMALVNYNSNPAAIAPDQAKVHAGLEREDLFTVVLEQFMTDTARRADYVLPVTTFLEHTDLYIAYGHYYLQMARPALAPPGECKSNVEIFRALALAMGFADACFRDTEDDMIRQALASEHPWLRGITLEKLEAAGHLRLNLGAEPGAFLPFAEGKFPTAHGKFVSGGKALAYTPPTESRLGEASPYPLELISWKSPNAMNSTFGFREDTDQETAVVYLHPEDAEHRGIAAGARVRLFNARGAVELVAALEPGFVQPGVVCAPSVRWPAKSPGGKGINVLTSQRLTDIGEGATFYNCRIEVEAC